MRQNLEIFGRAFKAFFDPFSSIANCRSRKSSSALFDTLRRRAAAPPQYKEDGLRPAKTGLLLAVWNAAAHFRHVTCTLPDLALTVALRLNILLLQGHQKSGGTTWQWLDRKANGNPYQSLEFAMKQNAFHVERSPDSWRIDTVEGTPWKGQSSCTVMVRSLQAESFDFRCQEL